MWCTPKDPKRLTKRIQTRLLVSGTLINAVAAFSVATYLLVIFPPESNDSWITKERGLLGTGLYVVFASIVGGRHSARLWRRTREWMASGEPPTPKQRKQLLRLPKRLSLTSFALWLPAALLFGVLSIDISVEFGVEVATSTALAALTTAAAVFLSAERILRPAVAMALDPESAYDTRSLGIGPRLVLTWLLCSGVPLIMLALIPLGREAEKPDDLIPPTLFVVGISFVVVLVATKVASGAVTRPVRSMRKAIDRVREGDLDVEVAVDDGSELGRLQAGFNAMVAGLREREQLRDLFGRQVGLDVARKALEQQPSLGGQTQTVSALFVDVVGSTALAERESPERVVALLNRFFEIVVTVVDRHGGMVNKFEGDAALCVFGAPIEVEDHAARALAAARDIRAHLDRDDSELDAAIGVACGEAVAGYVGSEQRFEYTVIGDPVNEASRLTELAKQRPCRLLASADTIACAGDPEAANWEVDGEVTLRGRTTPTRLAEPCAAALRDTEAATPESAEAPDRATV
ncbi:MAG: adenylate/guanylate cyclase domain-containing protein [Actinomycetota bacterium]|nr:adenylate/guanylate cyclase domain-containing protein [Actinomycetota bacterium]